MGDLFGKVFEKLGSGLDHIGSALNRLISSETTYDSRVIEDTKREALAANVISAIAQNETRGVEGDPYSFKQPSGSSTLGEALGKYQTTAGELKSWSKEFYGQVITPEQYIASPTIQDEYTKKKVVALLKSGATPAEVFALHRAGLTGYADPKVRAKKVKERAGYVNKGLEFLKNLPQD